MYKLNLPISMNTINKHTLPIYIEQAKKCKANRIFIGGMGTIYTKNSRIYTMPDKIKTIPVYAKTPNDPISYMYTSKTSVISNNKKDWI